MHSCSKLWILLIVLNAIICFKRLNALVNYNLDMATYARSHGSCNEYIFDDTLDTYPNQVARCTTAHLGKIVKFTNESEWDVVRVTFNGYHTHSMFFGVKMAPFSNHSYNLTYDDGTSFNASKYSMHIYEENNSTSYVATQTVYHIDWGYQIHGEAPTIPNGVICNRLYNGTVSLNPSLYHTTVNDRVENSVLAVPGKDYDISMVECTILCKLWNTDQNGCYGIEYDIGGIGCILRFNPFYEDRTQDQIDEEEALNHISHSYYDETRECQ